MQILSWRSSFDHRDIWNTKKSVSSGFSNAEKTPDDTSQCWAFWPTLNFCNVPRAPAQFPSFSLQKILLGYIFKWTKSRQVVVQLAPSWTAAAWAIWPVLTWCLCWSVAETGLCAIAHVQLPRAGTRKWRIWEDSKNINRILEILNLGGTLFAA